ncbi:MAG: pilus assembly protein PilM [Lachnospiraceae bacterium]|nr:pilus assembly protein PilM [Lachnospiraceae bacterium]
MAKKILGIDMGENSLKLALMSGREILKTVSVPMPDHMLKEGRIVSGETMGELVRTAMQQNGIRTKDAACVMTNETVFVKNVTLPNMSPKQLAYNLPFEFRDYITGETSDYVFDYATLSVPEQKKGLLPIGKAGKKAGKKGKDSAGSDSANGGNAGFESSANAGSGMQAGFGAAGGYGGMAGSGSGFAGGYGAPGGNGPAGGYGAPGGSGFSPANDASAGAAEANPDDSVELLAVGAPRQAVDELRTMLHVAGLKLRRAAPAICTYTELLRLSWVRDYPDRELCILDLGSQAIRMYIFKGDRYTVTREIENGLNLLDGAVADAFNVDEHLAHTYLLTNYEGCQQHEGCLNTYGNIALDLMRAMNFYRFSNPDSNLNDVLLCGGGSLLEPLREEITQSLGMDIHFLSDLIPGVDDPGLGVFAQAIGITLQ